MTYRSSLLGGLGSILIACGPRVVPSSDEATSVTSSSSTTESPSASSGTLTSSSSSSPADTGSTSAVGEDSSTGECIGCTYVPITFDTELARGFTPAEALAVFQGVTTPLRWTAYEGAPETVLHIDAAYVGGAVGEGPPDEYQCTNFLNVPCPRDLSMEIEITLHTDDGALDWTAAAVLQGIVGDGVSLRVSISDQDIGTNAGTLVDWPLTLNGAPFVLEQLGGFLIQADDDLGVGLTTPSRPGDSTIIADTP